MGMISSSGTFPPTSTPTNVIAIVYVAVDIPPAPGVTTRVVVTVTLSAARSNEDGRVLHKRVRDHGIILAFFV